MSISFETHPDRYRHWKLGIEGSTARLTMQVELRGGLSDAYELKLNSYDLGVDIELADAVQRLRFEHPEVRAIVIDSGIDRCFCAGANIPMLGGSSHAFKVNFCKFTNETRLYIEDASRHSGQAYLAALNGTCAGGGYELALACDEMILIDDGSSAVSLPEVPLLGVLPGTGGLTRLVDKRRVRRDLADVFCTTSEGVRGKRAVDWGLVDAVVPRSRFAEAVAERAEALASSRERGPKGPAVVLEPLAPTIDGDTIRYRHVELALNVTARTATLTIEGPDDTQPTDATSIERAGSSQWSLRVFRELDDALLRLRFHHHEIGVVLLHTRGDIENVLAIDEALHGAREHWLANEIVRHQARVLRRLDITSKSFFALIDEGSCFGGSLLELALAADRAYMLADDDGAVTVAMSSLNRDSFPMYNDLSRLDIRFLAEPSRTESALGATTPVDAEEAEALGIITVAADDIDWEDDVRIAIEERVSLSPDSLTGMEASLRFAGPETMETKIFARLSAWQNWIFQRPNAVGPQGALTKYGEPDRPVFQWSRC
jgi:benzoyl-CoA-dihydrodiol lyase